MFDPRGEFFVAHLIAAPNVEIETCLYLLWRGIFDQYHGIAGPNGTGAVFFTGCNLRCVFCQNREISRRSTGETLTVPRLRDTLLRLRDTGVHNINLVTGSHFVRPIAEALEGLSLGIPVVWNSSGYESVESLRLLKKSAPAKRYSAAADYPETAMAAIREMLRQRGAYELDGEGLLRSGVLVRHLILPGQEEAAMDVMDFLAEEFPPDTLLFSLMSQYTPMQGLERFPELQRRVDAKTNDNLVSYMRRRGLDGYWQEPSSATEDMIPAFDGTGV